MIWGALFLVALAAPFVIEALRKPIAQKAPATFAHLRQGITHYQWYGPQDGPVAVCVHGLSTPGCVWRGLANRLAGKGYRVLVYDLYGRGLSDRPGGAQDREFFLQQLSDLLKDQGVEGQFTLIGYSMGGAIATTFAARYRDRIRRLVLLAPAGLKPLDTGILGVAARLPVIGMWLMLCVYPSILRKGVMAEQGGPTSVENIHALQVAELQWRGFIPAVRASLRGVLSEDLSSDHRAIERTGMPVLAIWGAQDEVIPLSCAQTLKTWNKDAQNVVIEGAGHGLVYSHTDAVMDHIDHAG